MKIFVNLFLMRWILFLLDMGLYDYFGHVIGDALGNFAICSGGERDKCVGAAFDKHD